MNTELQKAFDVFGLNTESPENAGESPLPIIEKSVDGHTVYVIDRFDKGKLFYSISDVISDFLVEKTGKEIKVKLAAAKSADDIEAQSYVVQAAEWLKLCPSQPTDTTCIGDYELKNMKLKFGTVPVCFSWDDVYEWDKANKPESQSVSYSSMVGEAVKEKVVPVDNPLRRYNQCIRMYVEARVESLILDTVINNMNDKKRYKLSAEQAAKLGY